MNKTKILESFKEAITALRERVPQEDAALVKQVERAFVELRQHASSLQGRLDQVEAELQSAQQEAVANKAEAERLRREAESLAQKAQNKAGEVSQLQNLLLQQTSKGYNTEMIQDFLAQLEMDLTIGIHENEHPGMFNPEYGEAPRRYMLRYGQKGGFIPAIFVTTAGTDAARASEKRMVEECREQKARLYRSELEHLTALKDRFAHALECCRHPYRQLSEVYRVAEDGSIVRHEEWRPMDESTARKLVDSY